MCEARGRRSARRKDAPMSGKTLVLRKAGHWYVMNSGRGDERELLLALLEHAERQVYDIRPEEVYRLLAQLGWKVEHVGPGMSAA